MRSRIHVIRRRFVWHVTAIFVASAAAFSWGAIFEGTLQVMIHDDIDGTVKAHHLLHVGNDKWLRLEYASPGSRTLGGGTGERLNIEGMRREVKVEGNLRDNRLYVDRLPVPAPKASSAPSANPEPAKPAEKATALVLKIGFQGRANTMDEGAVHQAVFGETGRTTNTFYRESSYGTFKLVGIRNPAGDIYSLTLSGNGCDAHGGYPNAAGAARDMARRAGFEVNSYDVVIHSFVPGASGCPGGGVAGGAHANLFVGLDAIWDFGAHEVGHCDVLNGLGHASSFTDCSGASGDVVTYGGTCGHDEYGDQTDIMGGRNFSFTAYYRERAGWLPASNRLIITESRRVDLLPINTPATGIQTVYIPKSTGNYFNLEFRRPEGFDRRLETGLTDGVLVRVTDAPGRRSNPHIIDMTPGNGFQDAVLREGRVFRSTNSGDDIEITVVEVTGQYAVVDIVLDGKGITPVNIAAGRRAVSRPFRLALPGAKVLSLPLGVSEGLRRMEVLDPLGRSVHRLDAGKESLRRNGMAGDGSPARAGAYVFRLNTDRRSILRTAVVSP